MANKLNDYYTLTKPGIVYGNAVHIIAGFLLSLQFGYNWMAGLAVLIGTSFVIASACVMNNILDRHIDAAMARTKKRALVTGVISPLQAFVYGIILLAIGFSILYFLTNLIVCTIGVIAYIFYVFIYTYSKRYTVHSTLIGTIPGALPGMAGYVAGTGQLDMTAWLIFFLLVAWQMAHFYAISLFRKKEYTAAKLPVLAVVKPPRTVMLQIIAYTILYAAIVVVMALNNVFGIIGAVIMLVGATWWMKLAMDGYKKPDAAWAKKVFIFSLYLTIAFLVSSGVGVVLP